MAMFLGRPNFVNGDDAAFTNSRLVEFNYSVNVTVFTHATQFDKSSRPRAEAKNSKYELPVSNAKIVWLAATQ